MGSPSKSLAMLRPDLAASVEEFDLAADRQGFIAGRILPQFDVALRADTFGRIPIEQLLQRRDTSRTNRGGYSRGDWKFEDDSYATKEKGAEEPVDDRESRIYASYFDAEVVATARALDVVLRDREIRVAAQIFNADTWTPTPVSVAWDVAATATPITDVEAAIRRVWAKCGLWPNAMVINRLVFRNLRNCEQILDRIASQGAGDRIKASDVTASQLAACFDLAEVIVAGSPQNSADKGQPVSIAPIWSSDYAMLACIARSKDLREPCLGRTFHWTGDGSEFDGTVETYREEGVRGDIVRVRNDVDEKIIYEEAADLLSGITTSA